MTKSKNFLNLKLDKEEKKIEKASEKGEFVSASDFDKTKDFFKQAAKNYRELQKSKRITIRLNQEDLLKVKVRAKKIRIPYQTLLGALVHQYAKGQAQIEI